MHLRPTRLYYRSAAAAVDTSGVPANVVMFNGAPLMFNGAYVVFTPSA